MDWKPFNTAPRDGSVFLAWDATGYGPTECVCLVTFWPADDEGNPDEFVMISNGCGEVSEPVEFTYWAEIKPPVQA